MRNSNTLILASSSRTRRAILENAGVEFLAIASDVEEEKIKNKMLFEEQPFQKIAEKLAYAKAEDVAKHYPNNYVLGCDQLLVCEDKLFSKASHLTDVKDHLRFFRNKTHQLITSCVIMKGSQMVWCHTEIPELTMRDFSEVFLDRYLRTEGKNLLETVGCYFIEGRGIQLFSKVDGEFSAILGLPLLPLMERLRNLDLVGI